MILFVLFGSVHYVKRPGAVLDQGSQVAKLDLDDPTRVHRVRDSLYATKDRTTLNPSTIDVMVGSPCKKQMRVRDMLQSFGNLFLLRLVIYYEFERV